MIRRRPFAPSPRRRTSADARESLTGNRFGRLTGTFDWLSAASRYRRAPDDNHVYLWVRLQTGFAYECAVNTAPRIGASPLLSHMIEDECAPEDLPSEGFFFDEPCSYELLGLCDADFIASTREDLSGKLAGLAITSARLSIFGVTYANGEGMHDIHLNSHEPLDGAHRDRVDEAGRATQDGCIVFYSAAPSGRFLRRHFFLKFASQRLG